MRVDIRSDQTERERVALIRFKPWIGEHLIGRTTDPKCRWDGVFYEQDGKTIHCLAEVKLRTSPSTAYWFRDEGVIFEIEQIRAMQAHHPYGYFIADFSDAQYAIEIGSLLSFSHILTKPDPDKIKGNYGTTDKDYGEHWQVRRKYMLRSA
jgi:hypothetical protein